jgi:hypothetical protein
MEKNPDPEFGIDISEHISENFFCNKNFCVKKYFNSLSIQCSGSGYRIRDPVPVRGLWIRDGKIWIRDEHPGFATLIKTSLKWHMSINFFLK